MIIKKLPLILIVLLSTLFILLMYQSGRIKDQIIQRGDSLSIGNSTVTVELANTPEKQTKGLSGKNDLKEGSGMLFPYSPPQEVVFWMKDMLIPIDIIFIKDNKVVAFYENATPEPGVPLNQLKRYSSNQPIDFVLEVPAGWGERNNVEIGASAIYKPMSDRSGKKVLPLPLMFSFPFH